MQTSSSTAHRSQQLARAFFGRVAKEGFLYLYHLEQPLGRPQTPEQRELHGLPPREGDYEPHAGHYFGFTEDLARRDQEHQTGGRKAAALLRAAKRRGISYRILRAWRATDEVETRVKSWKKTPCLCPECSLAPKNIPGAVELTPAEIREALIPF